LPSLIPVPEPDPTVKCKSLIAVPILRLVSIPNVALVVYLIVLDQLLSPRQNVAVVPPVVDIVEALSALVA